MNKEQLEIINKNSELPVFVSADHGQELYRCHWIGVIIVDTEEDLSETYCLEDCGDYFDLEEALKGGEEFLSENGITEEDRKDLLKNGKKALLFQA